MTLIKALRIFLFMFCATLLFIQGTLHSQLYINKATLNSSKESSSSVLPNDDYTNANNNNGNSFYFRSKRHLDTEDDAADTQDQPLDFDVSLPSSDIEHFDPTLSVSSVTINWDEIPSELLLKNIYSGNFSYPNPSLCHKKRTSGELNQLKLLILITTAIDHFELRKSIRMTWGHFGQRQDTVIGFVVGDGLFNQYNISTLSQLQTEMETYGDFIIASFDDTYRNLTLKTIHMLHWTKIYCPNVEYVLKTDDDVFVNVPELLRLIQLLELRKDSPKIYGHIFAGHLPNRDTSHKHHVPFDVYPEDVIFPNFTSGPAYLLPNVIVPGLFTTALNFPLIPLEDVLITGFVADRLQIDRVSMPQFLNEIYNPINLPVCTLPLIYAGMTNGTSTEMYELWYRFVKSVLFCPNLSLRPDPFLMTTFY